MADMSERMICKGGLQGLLQEASLVGSSTEQYYLETSDNEDDASTIWSLEWTMLAYGPEVGTDPLETMK